MTEHPAKQGISHMFDPFLRKLAFSAAAVLALGALGAGGFPVAAKADGELPAPGAAAPMSVTKSVELGLDKSVVIDLPRDARDILVSNPAIADAVIRTPRRIYLTGIAVGQANVIVFDRAGQQIVTLNLAVERDGVDLNALLQRLIPDSDIKVDVVSDNVVLSGSVKSAVDAKKAEDIANVFVNGGVKATSPSTSTSADAKAPSPDTGGSGSVAVTVSSVQSPGSVTASKVVNLLTIQGEDQVHIKVTVAEVERTIAKQLGIDLNGSVSIGSFKAAFATNPPFGLGSTAPSSFGTVGGGDTGAGLTNFNNGLYAQLRALDQTGVVRTLAEPTLTAISGESASFLAGGEFPVPTGFDSTTHELSVTFKQFGVALSFTPVVLSDGRISLHVKTEDSELSNEGAVSLGAISIPSLKVRRAETTMELPSGGAMVMGGLIQDDVRQSISGLPGLKNLPILGPLFRSRDYQRNETELVIIVTPYLVDPVARSALARPDDGFAPASDRASDLFGNINKVYGIKGKPAPSGTYQGSYGFIYQ